MSRELVGRAFRSFLRDSLPEVLCVTGKWGVGKTYEWQQTVKAESKTSSLKYYSYVSLFGLNSIDDLKLAIASSMTPINYQGAGWNLLGRTVALDDAARGTLQLAKWLAKHPLVSNTVGNLSDLAFRAVTQWIICLDDLERKGSDLRLQDVFGLVSLLCDSRACKVVILLNADELSEPDTKLFEAHFEKVADAKLTFDPSASENGEIAIPDTEFPYDEVKRCAAVLGIKNIRILRRISREVARQIAILGRQRREIIAQVVSTTTLLSWSLQQPTDAPSIAYLRQRNRFSVLLQSEPRTDEEIKWNVKLEEYDFGSLDDLDQIILNGLERGFYDEPALRAAAENMDRSLKSGDLRTAYHDVWESYHHSLVDNHEEFISAFEKMVREHPLVIDPSGFDGFLRIIRQNGQNERATDLIGVWLNARNGDFRDIRFYRQDGDPDIDAELLQRLEEARKGPKETPSVRTALLSIPSRVFENPSTDWLSQQSTEQFVEALLSIEGAELAEVVTEVLKWRFVEHSDPMRRVGKLVEAALSEIASRSWFQRSKIARWGIEPTSEPSG